MKIMDKEDLDEFIYEFHERVLGIIPERRLDWENLKKGYLLETLWSYVGC